MTKPKSKPDKQAETVAALRARLKVSEEKADKLTTNCVNALNRNLEYLDRVASLSAENERLTKELTAAKHVLEGCMGSMQAAAINEALLDTQTAEIAKLSEKCATLRAELPWTVARAVLTAVDREIEEAVIGKDVR